MLGRIFLILLVLVVLVVGAALVVPFFIPVEVYRTQIQNSFREATGRDIALDGEMSLSMFPPVSIRVTDVKIANAEWGEAPFLAAIDELAVGLEALPLLTSQQVKVSRFVLSKPQINLEVSADGAQNWVFEGPPDGQTPATDSASTDGTPQTAGEGGINLNDVSLGDVRLVDGQVRYVDGQAGQTYVAEAINVTVSLPSLDGPLGLDGTVTYNNEPLNLAAQVARPRDLIEGRMSAIDVKLNSTLMVASFDGQAASQTTGTLPVSSEGMLSLDVPSVRDLSAWAGSPLPEGDGFGPMKVEGTAKAQGDVIAFKDGRLSFDDMNGQGDFALNLGGARPKFTAVLGMDKIDTRPYEGAPTEESPAGDGPAGGQDTGANEGWSEEPIDLSGMNALDADVRITVNEFTTSTLNMGRSEVTTTLDNGLLTVDLKELALYEGGGTLFLEVNGRDPVATIRNRTKFDLIQARPLLNDLMGSDLLAGLGTMELDVTTRGRSQKDFVTALNGTGRILFNDGALYGLDLVEMVELVTRAKDTMKSFNPAALQAILSTGDVSSVPALSTLQALRFSMFGGGDSGKKTDFAEMSGNFLIENGVLRTDDSQLTNPLLRVLGAGLTNMVEQTADITFNAGLLNDGQPQGTQIPIRFRGPWTNLQPDLAPLVRALVQDQLGSAIDRALPGDAGKILRNPGKLLEGDGEDAGSVIEGLFGRKKKDKDEDGNN